MIQVKVMEIIGAASRTNFPHGNGFDFSAAFANVSYSRTECTTCHSSGEQWASPHPTPATTPCYSTMHFNPRWRKASASWLHSTRMRRRGSSCGKPIRLNGRIECDDLPCIPLLKRTSPREGRTVSTSLEMHSSIAGQTQLGLFPHRPLS